MKVGEEYDGGSAYRGVNSDNIGNVNNVKWSHWLTEPQNPRIEMSSILSQQYPWLDLAPVSSARARRFLA